MASWRACAGFALCSFAFAWTAFAAGLSCPAYPSEQRTAQQLRLTLERDAAKLAKARLPARAAGANVNFIDDLLFGKMAADGIEPAPPATDAELLRRVSLDLMGRIPSPEQVTAWLKDDSSAKFAGLLDSLIGSPAFVDYWTLYYAGNFEVTSDYYYFIGIPGRNQFYRFLRNFVETWDELTNRVTSGFLGVQSQCISCHDGRRHLEKINLFLSTRRRQEFWQQSAFFSRMSILE